MLSQYNYAASKWYQTASHLHQYTVKTTRLTNAPPPYRALFVLAIKQRAELKQLIRTYGWPTIRLVGFNASEAALSLLTDVGDPQFEEHMLPVLNQDVAAKKIWGVNVAQLVDKMREREHKSQLYGTLFTVVHSKLELSPSVEDPAHLDARRRHFGLPPESEFKEQMTQELNFHSSGQ